MHKFQRVQEAEMSRVSIIDFYYHTGREALRMNSNCTVVTGGLLGSVRAAGVSLVIKTFVRAFVASTDYVRRRSAKSLFGMHGRFFGIVPIARISCYSGCVIDTACSSSWHASSCRVSVHGGLRSRTVGGARGMFNLHQGGFREAGILSPEAAVTRHPPAGCTQ